MLIADDEERSLALVAAMAENIGGVELLFARDGVEAIEIARRQKPDVAILDVLMPKRNGHEVCLNLKRDPATAGVKVIIITGLDGDCQRQKALHDFGADSYFSKPFSPRALLEEVDKLLALR